MCSKRFIALLLSLCLFGPSFPALSYSEEAETLPISHQSAMRIYQISQRLQEIAKERESERIDSLNQIDALLKEVESLRAELSTLKNQSSVLSQDSETTASQSDEQAKEIARLAVLAESLKASFKTYRDLAETKIKRLDFAVKALTVIAGLLVVGAASGWTAWAVK